VRGEVGAGGWGGGGGRQDTHQRLADVRRVSDRLQQQPRANSSTAIIITAV